MHKNNLKHWIVNRLAIFINNISSQNRTKIVILEVLCSAIELMRFNKLVNHLTILIMFFYFIKLYLI